MYNAYVGLEEGRIFIILNLKNMHEEDMREEGEQMPEGVEGEAPVVNDEEEEEETMEGEDGQM